MVLLVKLFQEVPITSPIDLLRRSKDWFLYNRDHRYERVKTMGKVSPVKLFNIRSGSQNDIPEQNYFKRLPKFKLMLP